MPKNRVSDLITDQEMAFARLVLSGTMTDSAAAQAAGLNPDTAGYTKSKPRVRAYMLEHRAAMQQQLLDQEADLSRRAVEGLRRQELRREQVLARLWEIAKLSPEMTRGSITGQVKALSMIVAIESLIPDRRLSPPATQPTAPPVEAQIYASQWRRKQQHHAAGEEPGDPVAATKTQPAAPHVPEPEPTPEPVPKTANESSSPNLDQNQTSLANPFINPVSLNRVPAATDFAFDAILDKANSVRLSFSPDKRFSGRRR